MGKIEKKIKKNAKRFFTALSAIEKSFQETINEQPEDVRENMLKEIHQINSMSDEEKQKLKDKVRNKRKSDNKKRF